MNENSQAPGASLRLPLIAVLTISTIIGLWAIFVRLSQGLIVTNLTQFVPWGFWIALYIYFIGLSAGSFLLSTLVYVFNVKRFETIGPLALFQALICMILGLALVFVDLGHPFRFLNVFLYFNPTSILAWESLAYMFYIAIILGELYFVLGGKGRDESWRETSRHWLKVLGIIGIPIAIAVHGGTGAIFAVVKSRPSWYTGLFPIIFLVSALVSGGAGLTFLTAFALPLKNEKKLQLVKSLAKLVVCFVALDLLLLFSDVLVTFYGGIPGHIAATKITFFGPFWWVFWIIQIGLGAVIPIIIVSNSKTGNSIGWLGLMGLLVMIGIIGVRLNIVIPPQIIPQFSGLPDAYHSLRYAGGYFPSLNEWLVGLGIIAIGTSVFFGTLKYIFSNSIPNESVSEGKL